MKLWRVLIIILFCLAACHSAANANGPLFLSGAVIDTKVICVHEKPAVEINLLMQWRNDGNEPLILLNPFYIFETRATFGSRENASEKHISGDVLSYNPYLKDPYGKTTEDDYDPVANYVRLMKGRFLIGREVTVEPGRYHESLEIVRIRNGFRFVDSAGKTVTNCNSAKLKAVPDYEYFKLEFFLSLKKYKGGEDALASLRRNWRKKGNFLLNSSGDISYRSESIPFHDDK
jgi:hypothetical protein